MFFVSKKEGDYKLFQKRLDDNAKELFRSAYSKIITKDIDILEETYQETEFDPHSIYISDTDYFAKIENILNNSNFSINKVEKIIGENIIYLIYFLSELSW